MSDLIDFDDEVTAPNSALPEFVESSDPTSLEFDDDAPTGEVGPPGDVEPEGSE